jgi:uncharacterized protein YPO0396
MTQDDKLKVLQKKIRMLRKSARAFQRKIARNKRVLHKLYRMADLLQSYIPDRRWKIVVLISSN